MTNSWNDIKNADVVIIMGGNAAEAHPCGFKWVTEAKANNGAKLIVVDPRFTRSASVSDLYAPLRPGTDIAFLSGVMRYLLANGKIHQEYVKAFTNASYIVKEGYGFQDGLFAGYDEALAVANDTPFGLSSGIVTRSLKHASHFKRHSQAGMVMVNLPTAGVDYHTPFGGRKASSYGPREQGAYAREFYTVVKTVYELA